MSLASKDLVRKRIREIRKQKGLTQKQLAEKLGITQAGVSAMETNSDNITTKTIANVADALGVHFVDLTFDLGDIEADGQLLEIMNFRYEDLLILEKFKMLNADGQHEAIKRISELTQLPEYTKNE